MVPRRAAAVAEAASSLAAAAYSYRQFNIWSINFQLKQFRIDAKTRTKKTESRKQKQTKKFCERNPFDIIKRFTQRKRKNSQSNDCERRSRQIRIDWIDFGSPWHFFVAIISLFVAWQRSLGRFFFLSNLLCFHENWRLNCVQHWRHRHVRPTKQWTSAFRSAIHLSCIDDVSNAFQLKLKWAEYSH